MSPLVHSRIDTVERAAVITTEFDQPVAVVRTLFADPTKLARWWGPPGMPMQIHHHDLHPGGSVELTVSTPGGDVRGRWAIHQVAAPHTLRFTFASDGLDPTEITVELRGSADGSTTMEITARFASDDAMRHALDIGFVEGVARACSTAHDVVAVRAWRESR
jgi:uncharacterized protein YndB with AHSA1/START domain